MKISSENSAICCLRLHGNNPLESLSQLLIGCLNISYWTVGLILWFREAPKSLYYAFSLQDSD